MPYVKHILHERPILGHIHCFRQCEIMGSQILLYGAQPCDAGASSWSPPVLWRESWQDPLGICVIIHMCPKRVRRRGWTIAVNSGCPVCFRTLSLQINWCHLILNIKCSRSSGSHIWCKVAFWLLAICKRKCLIFVQKVQNITKLT